MEWWRIGSDGVWGTGIEVMELRSKGRTKNIDPSYLKQALAELGKK
jgi:hypothetical protein